MKKSFLLGSMLVFLLLLSGCGAGIIHQTTKNDLQAIPYNDTKAKARTMFYEGRSSIGSYGTPGASIKITEEGFQVISEATKRQASCAYEVGDPYVKDWGPAALDSRFGVHSKGCNIDVWFKEKEPAIMFAQLLYTLKQQAAEEKSTHDPPTAAAVADGKTKRIKTESDKLPPKTVRSDVDEIPLIKTKQNKNSYAIVIGIEQYRQKLPKADFAVADAKTISEYLTRTMGYPEENVITLLNDRALKSDMEKYFDRWLSNNVEENGRVFIYYSGHGAPNTKTGDVYLVPYDGDPTFITETGYSIARLYESLGKLKAKDITVVLDSCFSGAGGRSVLAKGAKPLVMTINMPAIHKNISVMTASSGDQISSAYEEGGHGLFTYFLLKGIKDENVIQQDGSIKMEELFGYIKPQVERIARKQFNNEQTPQLIGAKKE
jgi:hypothetical protein